MGDPCLSVRKKIKNDGANRNITIDVTGSAPTMDEPGETLERVFKTLTADKQPNEIKILDVGAAKLRNTLYLLQEGFVVYAVEFEELPKRMPQAKENWERAKDFDNFRHVTFPKNFFKLHDKVDIALLINVINVMPIPAERLVLLSLCREKMKKDGLLLLYNWRDISSNPGKYTAQTAVNDGYFKGWGKKYKKKNKTFSWWMGKGATLRKCYGLQVSPQMKKSTYLTLGIIKLYCLSLMSLTCWIITWNSTL